VGCLSVVSRIGWKSRFGDACQLKVPISQSQFFEKVSTSGGAGGNFLFQ